jgi:leader peptidase (prepilin peptidase)/N-methyltransferase
MPQSDPVVIVLWSLWFAVLGACVGSFLNVLVYRLPLRKSLVHPPSHCPRCGHAIRWYDNIPVLGWIRLRGKCRDCKMPISVRYPCVEGFCGILFVGVFILIAQLSKLPFWLVVVLTLLLSLSGIFFLAFCLILYDKRKK